MLIPTSEIVRWKDLQKKVPPISKEIRYKVASPNTEACPSEKEIDV